MSRKVSALIALALAAVVLILYFALTATTPIGNILKDPRSYEGKELTIAGEVTDRNSIIVVKYFRLRDTTGEIMVVTDKTLPAVGSRLRVQGKVREAFSVGPEQLVVFIEGNGGGKE